jgi:hypothetical protein
MGRLKTVPNKINIDRFLNHIEDQKKRDDSYVLLNLMKKITGEAPQMWGASIIGFGKYHYKYESGREGDWFLTGFSPRKQNLTLYIMSGFEQYEEFLIKLGKFKTGKSCLYIKKLEDIDLKVLEQLIRQSTRYLANKKWS